MWSPDQVAADPTSALLVRGATIVWTGDDDGAGRHVDAADEVVELDGALVTPAFVDTHVHLSQTGLALGGLDLAGVRSVGALLEALAAHARGRDDAVLLGFGWDDTGWPEGRPPTRAELDRASGGRLVYLSRVDAHSAVVSSALVAETPGIEGADGWDGTGRVERAAHHLARDAVHRLVPAAQREAALRRTLGHAAGLGIGCVHEISAPHINPVADLATLRSIAADATAAGSRVIDVVPYWGELHAVEKARELGCVGNAGDLCADGSIGSRTAALSSPYADAATAGHGYLSAEEVTAHVVACTRAGLQAGFHAIGDAGVTAVVDGMVEAARAVGLRDFHASRHRVEHLEMVTRDQAGILGALGVVASVQPAFDAAWGGPTGMYADRLGAQRAVAMNPYATLRAEGVRLSFGSDSPVTPLDPWGAVRAAVRHRTASERLGAAEALDAHTRGGRLAAGDDAGGVLAEGADASFAVWDAPSVEAAVDATPRCQRTVVRGVTVHDATS